MNLTIEVRIFNLSIPWSTQKPFVVTRRASNKERENGTAHLLLVLGKAVSLSDIIL